MPSILRQTRGILARIILHPRVNATIILIFGGRLPSHGYLFDVNNPYVLPYNAARLFWRLYEKDEIDLLRMYLRRDLDVIEFGSGIGITSVIIASTNDKNHRFVCVETNPFLLETLKTNLRLNAPEKEVIVLNRAVHYGGENEIAFQVTNDHFDNKIGNNKGGEIAHVKTLTLAETIKSQGVGEFVLVSDIEGSEAGMLIEDVEALANCRQMVIELHPTIHKGQAYSVVMLREMIKSYDFRLVDQRHNVHVFTR